MDKKFVYSAVPIGSDLSLHLQQQDVRKGRGEGVVVGGEGVVLFISTVLVRCQRFPAGLPLRHMLKSTFHFL